MIQRIQTIFLILVIIFMGLSFFFPLWNATANEGSIIYSLNNIKLMTFSDDVLINQVYSPYYYVAILAGLSIAIAAFEISKFKNRMAQMKLGALNAMLMAGTMGLSVYFATDLMKTMSIGAGQYGAGLFMPAIAMICNILANRFIRKDEKLVRSVDRIR